MENDKICLLHLRVQHLLYLKNCWIFLDKFWQYRPQASCDLKKEVWRKQVFHNKVQDLLFKVYYRYGKAGVGRVLQHPILIFKLDWGFCNPFATTTLHLKLSSRFWERFATPTFQKDKRWQVYTRTRNPARRAFSPANKVSVCEGLWPKIQWIKWNGKYLRWCILSRWSMSKSQTGVGISLKSQKQEIWVCGKRLEWKRLWRNRKSGDVV